MAAKKQKISLSDSNVAQPARIFDISKPGTLPTATPTARPVIVTNRTIVQDPMMSSQAPEERPAGSDQVSARPHMSAKLVVRPLSGNGSGDTDADGVIEPAEGQVTDEKQPTGKPGTVTISAENPPASQIPEEDGPAPASESTIAPPDTAATGSTGAQSETATETSPEQTELAGEKADTAARDQADDELERLVEEKTYFVPINAAGTRLSRHVFVFGAILIIILGAVWLDIALDAGFVSIPHVQPVTHFFRNQ